MRRGVLGGTFDPVQMDHLLLAEEARLRVPLDVVTFVPAGQPWRKEGRDIAPAADRLAMVRLAIEGHDAFDVSTIELDREGPSYIVDTLEALAAGGDELFFIMGADALVDLPHWREPQRIPELATVVVASRPGVDEGAMMAAAAAVPGLAARIVWLPMPGKGISSSDLRARARAGEPLRYLTPPAVAAYIREHGLYPAGSADAPRAPRRC